MPMGGDFAAKRLDFSSGYMLPNHLICEVNYV